MTDLTEETVLKLAEALRGDGWCCLPKFLSGDLVAALRADIVQQRELFGAAAVGRAQQRRQQSAVRTDATLWLRADNAAQRDFLTMMENVRLMLNRHLYLGLFDYEAHYSRYAPGAFYRRHLDSFSDQDNDVRSDGRERGPRRILSTVCYLNDDWSVEHGGELVLWDRNDCEVARIAPAAGTAVFFLSAELPHEVRPALAERLSIAGWFRTQGGSMRSAER